MLLTDSLSRLRVDLSDLTEALFTDDVLGRAVQRAVSDLSRFLPLDKMYEITLIFTVTDEDWDSAAAPGTYVTLANKPIKYDSETVKNNAGTVMVRDTGYYIDYANGKVTHISGGGIGNAEGCTISYTKSEVVVDISSIVDDLIRVERVEYPVGDIPQSKVPYEVLGDLLTVLGEGLESQAAMTANKHLAIYYKSKHTMPTRIADGSYPDFLDDTVILAASAYALFTLAIKYDGQAVTDMASTRTALGSIAAKHTLAIAALAKVTDYVNEAHEVAGKVGAYLESNETTDNAVDVLSNVTDDIANLRTAASSALGDMLTYLSKVSSIDLDKATTGAAALLVTGATKVNLVNLGSRVAEIYGEYASVAVGSANARLNAAMGYAQAAIQMLSNLRSYIEESAGWCRIAETFLGDVVQRISMAQAHITEAASYVSQIDRYLAEASQYSNTAGTDLLLADRFRAEAIERRNEAWAIWRDKGQYVGQWSTSPVRQTSK